MVREGLHDLVIAGPRLGTLSLHRIAVKTGNQQSKLQSLLSELVPIYEARDVEEFLAHLVATAAIVMEPQPTFALLCDRVTGEPDFESLHVQPTGQPELSAILGRYLDLQGPVAKPVPVTDRGDYGTAATDPRLWIIPVIHDSRFEALLGVVSQPQAEEPAAGRLELLRLLSRISGPFLAASRDVRELRRARDQLEAILQIKAYFVSNMCHEFRSMLAAVQGYSKRILDGRAGTISDVQRDHLTVVLRNTNKLLDLVSHSLPFVAEQQLHVESFDLRETWQGALKRIGRRISEKSITVREQISAEAYTVTADRHRLAVVFDILVANAIHCTSNGGEITAQVLRGASGEVTVRLFAAGEGLPPQLVDRIFEHRDESAPAVKYADWPQMAGLSLVHDMVWLHGGRMSVTSNPGEGTMFTFTLPPAQTSLASKYTSIAHQ
jgi:signal transduction histidine kinase